MAPVRRGPFALAGPRASHTRRRCPAIDPTGEMAGKARKLAFDRRPMLQFRGSAITSDNGLRHCRELEDGVNRTWGMPV
jgi:hypothetical protein